MMSLTCQVLKFLDEHWDRTSPLLLGYSGGPDSKALLYLLLEAGVRPHLAHVDHGWREESAAEAQALREEADGLGLPFHTVRLEPEPSELAAREKRLGFFSSLFEKIPFQALLLAHQADDWAETALKRVLEGAHLVYLSGMKPISSLRGMTIWRPLLSIARRDLLRDLERRGLKAIEDATNRDPAYLRARMRVEMLPALSSSFGKEVSGNLALLAKRSLQLHDYLDRKTEEAFAQLQKGPWGWVLPPSSLEPLEICHLLQRLKLNLSRTVLEGLADALAKKLAHRSFGPRLLADRGYFFYLAETFPRFAEPVVLREGVFYSGDWRVEISSLKKKASTWLDFFLGEASFTVPAGSYQVGLQEAGDRLEAKKLCQQKIPAFLRPHVPHLYGQEGWVSDLFSLQSLEGYSVRFSCDTNHFCSV